MVRRGKQRIANLRGATCGEAQIFQQIKLDASVLPRMQFFAIWLQFPDLLLQGLRGYDLAHDEDPDLTWYVKISQPKISTEVFSGTGIGGQPGFSSYRL